MNNFKKLSILLAVPIFVAGCNGLESDYRDNVARDWTPWEQHVDSETRQEDLTFKSGQTNLTKAQIDSLRRIAVSTDGDASVFARVMTHDVVDRLTSNPTRDRVTNIVRTLIKSGVPRASIDVVSQASATSGAGSVITVIIDQSKARPIKCENWAYNMGHKLKSSSEPDFGCSTAANLAMMASNPRDLVEGRMQDTGDPARGDVFTQYYRDDKVRALLKNEKVGK